MSNASDKIDKIKNFFKKKKSEAKFKLNVAGPGRRLNDPESSKQQQKPSKPPKDAYVPPKRDTISEEAKRAADAALARFQGAGGSSDFNISLQAIRAAARKELEAERQQKLDEEQAASGGEQPAEEAEYNSEYAVQGVFFRCAMISDEVLPRKEWKVKIRDFLYEQLDAERGLTACLIIYNCNVHEKIDPCVETLVRYLENIIQHPEEEKYRKIRLSNKIFSDRVRYVEGAIDFLKGAGFTEQVIDDEDFLIYQIEGAEGREHLESLLEALKCSEPIPLELDRNIQVLLPSQVRKTALPPDFFRITVEELKREQQLRAQAIEEAQILKTKAMREREEQRVINRYKFALIRIRFADGVYLQGTFNVFEKLQQVFEFVRESLKQPTAEFSLIAPTGHKCSAEDLEQSLHDLKLIPNTILNFNYEGEWKTQKEFLKDELMLLIQNV